MSFPAQRSNAIYGDANAQTATVVPDLAAAADGVNFSVTNDSGMLNVNQQLVLQDFIYSTTTEEVYASILSPGHVAIIGNTMGWTDKQKMVLELDITFTIVSTIPNYPGGAPMASGSFDPKFVFQTMQGDVRAINMPNFNILQPIDNIIIQLGDNNQVIGRSQMNYLNGIKMIAQDNKLTSEDMREIVNLGSPTTHSGTMRDFGVAGSATNNTYTFQAKSNMRADFTQWQSTLYKQIQEYLAYTVRLGTPSPATLTPFKVGVPLKYINSFFREPGYLPPGLRYRIEVNYNTVANFFADWINENAYAYDAPDSSKTLYGRINMSYGTDMRLVYRRSDLRQPAAAAILNQWITRPFLYMYNTYEYVEIPTDGATTTFTKDIAISQQRPTSIFFKVLPDTTGSIFTTPVFRQLNANTQPRTGLQIFARDFANSDCAFIQFSNVKVNIAGRENYYLRTRTPTGSAFIPMLQDGTDMLNHLINKNVDQELDECALVSPYMVQESEGGYLQISINPGDFQKNGYMSSDTGATVIRVTFTCTNLTDNPTYKTIQTGYKIVIYKKLQEEIELDGKKDITTISWPAVKSNSNYLIQNTYNLN
jgi:hypothetical protein